MNHQSPIANHQIIINTQFSNNQTKGCLVIRLLVIGIYLIIGSSVIGVFSNAYALNLDKMRNYFLSGDYDSSINEGEKILAGSSYPQDIDELYYLLGLSYLKDGNFLRASDIFEIILKEFKNSAFGDQAKLGLGDTYFLRGDFLEAGACYKELISSNPSTKLKAQVYYRLSQAGYKRGDTQAGKEYLDKLKQDFPSSPELKLDKDLSLLTDSPDPYYTVQVGAFLNIANARNLAQKLTESGYAAYIDQVNLAGKNSYRVRVGKLRTRQEAQDSERKLIYEGYPTKIYP